MIAPPPTPFLRMSLPRRPPLRTSGLRIVLFLIAAARDDEGVGGAAHGHEQRHQRHGHRGGWNETTESGHGPLNPPRAAGVSVLSRGPGRRRSAAAARSSKSTSTICCQVPSVEAAAAHGERLRRPDDRGADVGVRVRVGVEAVVLVVALARDQAVERLAQVVHAARLVLHRRDGGGRARHEHRHQAAVDPGLLHDALHAGGDVDRVPVPLGREAELAAVDRQSENPPVNGSPVCSLEQLVEPRDLVRGHRVAVLRLGVAARAHLVGERADPLIISSRTLA